MSGVEGSVTAGADRPAAAEEAALERAPLARAEALLASERAQRPTPWALGLLSLALCLLAFTPLPDHGGDNAAYFAIGESMLDGEYRELWMADTPPHTRYPPLMPALAAVAQAVGLTERGSVQAWIPLKLLTMLFAPLATVLSYFWLRRRYGPVFAALVGLLVAWSPEIVGYSKWFMSDIPFFAFLMLALIGFERMRSEEDPAGEGGGSGFVIALAGTVLALATRTAGLPLVLAGAGWLAWTRRWRQLGIWAGVLGGLALLFFLRADALGGGDYIASFQSESRFVPHMGPEAEKIGIADFLGRMARNTDLYVRRHLPLLLYGNRSLFLVPVNALITLLAVVGWARRVRRPTVDALLVPIYVGMLLVWRTDHPRLFLPIYPIFLAYAAVVFTGLVEGWGVRARRWAVAGAVALFLAASAYPQFYQLRRGLWCNLNYAQGDTYLCAAGDHWRDYFAMLAWMRTELPEDALVVSRKPPLTYVIAERRGTYIPLTDEPADFFRVVEATGVRYLLLGNEDQITDRYLAPVLRKRPAPFCELHSLGEGRARLLGIRSELAVDAGRADDPGAMPTFERCPAGFADRAGPGGAD